MQMADLPNGSTIGGERIIHKGIANKHRHHASQIDGLNPLFYGDVGDGGGIDADVLSGKTYNDLSQEFLQVRNDSISSLTLSQHPTSGDHAASLLYLKNSIPNNLLSGNFFGITSIGLPTEESYSYTIGSYSIAFSSMDVLINGAKFNVPTKSIDVRTITPDYQNRSFYFYIEISQGTASYTAHMNKAQNTDSSVFIGTANTNGSGLITEYIPIRNEEKMGIGSLMLSKTPKPYTIPVSLDTGKVDSGWVFGAKGETVVDLSGQSTVYAREFATYTISNFNSFSNYTVSIDTTSQSNGAYIDTFTDDTLVVYTGDISPSASTIELVINRDTGENIFPITLMADAPVSISGPSEVQSGGLNYQFTINNYIEEYTYTVSATNGTIQRNGNIITYVTPVGIDNDIQGSITVSREGSSDTITFNIIAVAPYEIVGRDEVYGGWYFDYTITPHDPQISYTIETTPVTPYTINGDTIRLETPTNVTTDYNIDLRVSSSVGTATKNILVSATSPLFDITSLNKTASSVLTEGLPVTYYKDVDPMVSSYSIDHEHPRLATPQYSYALGNRAFYAPETEFITKILRIEMSDKNSDFSAASATFNYNFSNLNTVRTFSSGGGNTNMYRTVANIRGSVDYIMGTYYRNGQHYLLRSGSGGIYEDPLSASVISQGDIQVVFDAYSTGTYSYNFTASSDIRNIGTPTRLLRYLWLHSYNYSTNTTTFKNGVTGVNSNTFTAGGFPIIYGYNYDTVYIESEDCYLSIWVNVKTQDNGDSTETVYIDPQIAFIKFSTNNFAILSQTEIEIPSQYLTNGRLEIETRSNQNDVTFLSNLLSSSSGMNICKGIAIDGFKRYCTILKGLFIYHDYDNNTTTITKPIDNDIIYVLPEADGNVICTDLQATKITYIRLPQLTMETIAPPISNVVSDQDYQALINPNPRTMYNVGMRNMVMGTIQRFGGSY